MRAYLTAGIIVVLGIAAWGGVAFSCTTGPPPPSAALEWINPSGTVVPASHTYVKCSETGANTANLGLTASNLGPGDSCQFVATLFDSGTVALMISSVTSESTPAGDPTFSTCFSFALSAGPPSGRLAAGTGYPYTATIGMLSSAASICAHAAGTVRVTFSGTSPCGAGPSSPPRGLWLGPGANLHDANLQGLDLAGYDMAGDNLEGANLSCDDLQYTDLQGANLQGATLSDSNLTGACLAGANLQSAQLVDTILSGGDFQGANLHFANLEGSTLTGSHLLPTNFNGANLQGVNLAQVTATGFITAVGANTAGAMNVASCTATSGTSTYCDEL